MSESIQCPECNGTGKGLQKLPPMANTKAPVAQPHRHGQEICRRYQGSGKVSID